MLVAREFDRDTFLAIGVKKGELVASAPERHQRKLLNSAKKGKSFSELRTQLDKLEGRSRGDTKPTDKDKGASPANERVTLLGHVKKGEDIEVPWLSSQSHEPIIRSDTKGKYAIIQLTDEVELVLIPTDNDLGMVANFRKIGEQSELPPEDSNDNDEDVDTDADNTDENDEGTE